jgi:outer membrane scaffolding protein for murein synthesis (MipA/OmpV family)
MPTSFPGRTLLLVVTVTFGAYAEQNLPNAPADWMYTVGGGAVALPSYPGAGTLRVMPLPLIDVRSTAAYLPDGCGAGGLG